MKKSLSVGGVAVFALAVVCGTWLVLTRQMRNSLLTTLMATSPVVATPQIPATPQSPTVVTVNPTILHQGVKRLGMNLGGQDFFDSQQILKNMVSRNPGFEGQQWQTVIQCGKVTATSCTNGANNGSWPEGFMDGGTYEVITGAASGQEGAILHSTASNDLTGGEIQYSHPAKPLSTGDYIVARKSNNDDATTGWDPQVSGGGVIAAESDDLRPGTQGRQAVRLSAPRTDQGAGLKQYFDSTPGKSYVQLRGPYLARFWAKGGGGNSTLNLSIERYWNGANGQIFRQSVQLTSGWKEYSLPFLAHEPRDAIGTVAFGLSVSGGTALIDDVSLTEADGNGTAFRNGVVSVLKILRPGILRYMDSGQNFGCTLDNMLAPQFARKRCGFNRYLTSTYDVPIGLHDFLVLSENIGADPWYTMQIGMTTTEAANLCEYLGGPISTKYGAIRAALGHPVPWTQTFNKIHLEFGNEAWNTAQGGASIPDPVDYAARASTVLHEIRSSPWYQADRFNLIANAQSVNVWLTTQLLQHLKDADSIDIAPYIFNTFNDSSSVENIFGPMLAQPQSLDSAPTGDVHRQANAAATAMHPVHLAVYETNIGTVSGTVDQASINATIPSIGAGIATIDHMLLMLRDLGITVQNTFQLGGGDYPFANSARPQNHETSPVWGVVVDIGGATDRVRPSFLAQQLANEAIRKDMLTTIVSGYDPTWDQTKSTNDGIALNHVHELQAFAFSDDNATSLLVLNLSRVSKRSILVDGMCAPQGMVKVATLTAEAITRSNETNEQVQIVRRQESGIVPGRSSFSLPPLSMTYLSGSGGACIPSP